MSEGFGNRIQAIRDAYVTKLVARGAFVAEWSRVSEEIILPVLHLARQNLTLRNLTLKIEGGNGSDIVAVVHTTPIGKDVKKLCYHPQPDEGMIMVASGGTPTGFPLDMISTDLVESHVEAYLREALRLGGE